jgi:decaprenylphospho-beta-D-ribofuranose 2-oxidase
MTGRTSVSGWARNGTFQCLLERPSDDAELREITGPKGPTSLIARGCGRSYGDAAVNTVGATVLTERLRSIHSFDADHGIVHCQSGVTIGDLLLRCVPEGWLPPVIPGTKDVSVGGAIAADIHGRNHWSAGTFARYVRSLRLLLADGTILECGPNSQTELF